MVETRISEHGALEVERTLLGVSGMSKDFSLAWKRIYRLILSIEQKQFSYGGTRGPNPWAPLSPITIADKRRKGLRIKKMHATEELATAMRQVNAPHQIFKFGDTFMEFGSDLTQFEVHQKNDAGKRMPFRPPVDPTEMDVRKMSKIIHDHVMSGAAGRQFGVTGKVFKDS